MLSETLFGIVVYEEVWLPTWRGMASCEVRGKALGSPLKAAPPAPGVGVVVFVLPVPWAVAVEVFQPWVV